MIRFMYDIPKNKIEIKTDNKDVGKNDKTSETTGRISTHLSLESTSNKLSISFWVNSCLFFDIWFTISYKDKSSLSCIESIIRLSDHLTPIPSLFSIFHPFFRSFLEFNKTIFYCFLIVETLSDQFNILDCHFLLL